MRVHGKRWRGRTALLLIAGCVALSGCREEEQGRILSFEKGTYLGKEDEKLPAEQRDALKQRAKTGQKF